VAGSFLKKYFRRVTRVFSLGVGRKVTSEIINTGQITPHRLYALVRLVPRLKAPRKQTIINMLQPSILVENQSSAESVYDAARDYGLIREQPDEAVVLNVEQEHIQSIDSFRRYMQHALLGVKEEHIPNYLFNLYSAWYATQDEQVLLFSGSDYDVKFNDQLFKDLSTNAFNMTKFNAWRSWAAFLGLGWPMKAGLSETRREILVPDAHIRLREVLSMLLPEENEEISINVFAERLAITCPELDGGDLFEYCWQHSRGSEQRGNNLSLMVSTGLRVLHDTGIIQLIQQRDASSNWYLYPAEGHPVGRQVTHIVRRGA
jgi:hypothetical protein